jgi:hypothetical protein
MAVQFPRDLAVANLLEIEVADSVKRLSRRPFPVYGIQMPIDRVTEVEIFVAQQIKPEATYSFRLVDNLRGLVLQPLTQQLDHTVYRLRGKKESARSGA